MTYVFNTVLIKSLQGMLSIYFEFTPVQSARCSSIISGMWPFKRLLPALSNSFEPFKSTSSTSRSTLFFTQMFQEEFPEVKIKTNLLEL